MEWLNNYVKEIKRRKTNQKTIIFGAGRVARVIFQLCIENGILIDGFCVSNLEENKTEIENIPVFQLDSLRFSPEETLILIGVKERGKQRISCILESVGYKNYIVAPDCILDCEKYESERKKRPTLEITPTIGCNVNCKFCPQQLLLNSYFKDNKNRKTELTFDEYKKILEKLPSNTLIEWAGFVEPFFHRQAADMMLYTKEHGYDQTLFTTLMGMTEEDFIKIKDIPFEMVYLHTPDEEGYANISVTKEYLCLLQKVINTTNARGEMFVTTANCQGTPHSLIIPITKGKLKIYCELSDRAGSISDDNHGEIAHFNRTGKIWCDRCDKLNHNVLLPDGTVVLCCNDWGLKHVLGNLLQDNYEDLMRSTEMREIKRALMVDKNIPVICRKCIYGKEIG